MAARRRRQPILPDYRPLAAYELRQGGLYPANDPASGYGWERWDEPSQPLTGRQKQQLLGAVGTVIYQGLISDSQYNLRLPQDWLGDRRWETIAAMERDGQVAAVTAVCVLPLLQATYSINPASESAEDVAVAQEVANNLLHGLQGGWHNFLRQFYRNRFRYGHYCGEKVWTSGDQGIKLRKIAVRPPWTLYRWFPSEDDELDRIMQRVWILNEGGTTGQWKFPVITAEKLVLSVRNQEGNDFRGVSLYYPMWKHWDFKNKLYLIDGIAAERNGMGVPVLEDPPLVRQQSDRDLAAQALQNFRVGEAAYMDLPAGYKFTLTGVSGAVRDIQPSIQHHDLLMARAALAHFINLDAYGQLTISESAQTLFLSSEEAEAEEATETLNAVIREWVDYNYEDVQEYPTLAITGIATRDLGVYLRGIAAMVTAGALTNNAETENSFRGDLDLPPLPAEATAAGGGMPSVDTAVQGKPALPPGEAQQPVVKPGSTAEQQLARTPPFSAGRLGERAIHLSGPPLRTARRSIGFAQPQREAEYLARDEDGSEWLCLDRKPGPNHSIPNPNTASADNFDDDAAALRGFQYVRWRLGSGGASHTHCGQCVVMSQKGLLKLSELHIEPGSGDTWCDQSCTCFLQYLKPAIVRQPAPSQGTTKR